MDFLNRDIKKYIGNDEQIELNESLFYGVFFWTGISHVCWALLALLFSWGISKVTIIAGIIVFFIFILYLGIHFLRLMSIRYIITNKRVMIFSGLLNKRIKDIPFRKITDATVKQRFTDKLFYSSGNILLNSAGGLGYEAIIEHIENPFEVKKIIDKFIP